MTSDLPWLDTAALFGSGRDALAALVRWGMAGEGWRRVWLPSYNCPEVPAALLTSVAGAQLLSYPDAMLDAPPALDALPIEAGDVVMVVNQLGIRPRPDVAPVRDRGAIVVEDHSHDLGSPWALESDADYAFASLRKTLPIPDGGAVWSPRGRALPPEPEADEGREVPRLAEVLRRRPPGPSAQLLFRALARSAARPGEPAPGMPIAGVSRALLPHMPIRAWRDRRRRNVEILAEASASTAGVRVLVAPEGGAAFALTLVFDDPLARDAARRELIARAVVPVVVWPLDPAGDWGAGPADADLATRILSVHVDQRFDAADMRHLAVILREALAG